MDGFISRKELEIHHSKAYELRDRLKQLGCEWDSIARVWIAPSLEVKELILEILDGSNGISYRRSWTASQFDKFTKDLLNGKDMLSGMDGEIVEPAPSIAHSPSKEEAAKICGEENVNRYWRDEVTVEAAAILASGENNWNQVYERLEDAGWRSRSVSLLKEVVEHFRAHPPIPALDEIAVSPLPLPSQAVAPDELDGAIAVITDTNTGDPVALKITFPYSHRKVNMVKWIRGRKWDASKKAWLVPIEEAQEVFSTFPHFQRSPKATEIKTGLQKEACYRSPEV